MPAPEIPQQIADTARVMNALLAEIRLTHVDLCRATGIPKGSLSRLLSALAGVGWIEKHGDRWQVTTRWLLPHMHAAIRRLEDT